MFTWWRFSGGGALFMSECFLLSARLNGCTLSRVKGVGGSNLQSSLLRTTASPVADPSSCCRCGSSWVSEQVRDVFLCAGCGSWVDQKLQEPCVSRFEGAFLSGSSRQLVPHSAHSSASGPSLLRWCFVLSPLSCSFLCSISQ